MTEEESIRAIRRVLRQYRAKKSSEKDAIAELQKISRLRHEPAGDDMPMDGKDFF